MLERIGFWFDIYVRGNKLFFYNEETGEHYAFDTYNIFTDEVHYRFGRFGTSGFGPYPSMKREEFLCIDDDKKWVRK